MSVWSGIAATGVAIALAFVVVGQPLWEWRIESPQQQPLEIWSYRMLAVRHTVYNQTTGAVTADRSYSYAELATLPSGSQPRLANVFEDFATFFLLGLVAAFAGLGLGLTTIWKKLRGLFAGIAFLAGCGSMLYASFAIVFSIPSAATGDFASLGYRFPEFKGQTVATTYLVTWTPLAGWILAMVAGVALAWSSSDFWHVRPKRKADPMKVEVPLKRTALPTTPPPPPVDVVAIVAPEPMIEEVFVIGSNGLLVKHMSRSLMTDKDRDVVGSMISAISSFIREAFSERDGEVHEVSLGDHRFVMCSDAGLVAAVLVTSGKTDDIVHRLRHLLTVLRDRYADRLEHWQGEALEGIEDELGVLWDPYHLPPPPVT